MSMLVGMLLHNALLNAGHDEWHTVRTETNWLSDEILVRFSAGRAPDGKNVGFRVPNHLFDPVEYAQEKWPDWFVKKQEKTT
jgi:hypothetical protein